MRSNASTGVPVAVTGAGGRLGRALLGTLRGKAIPAVAWSRPEYDLDEPNSASELLTRDTPRLVVHAAAWTDVDGCARDPELATRRNARAVAELAAACAQAGSGLVLVSTNEVFDGERSDGRGYVEDDPPRPINPYGASKYAGEQEATAAYERAGAAGSLWIVRTAWLYGPPGNDFPDKIVAAADRRAADGEPLAVVTDEFSSPTYSRDLARAILELADMAPGGVYHLVNTGSCSRFDWARAVLERCRPGRTTLAPISRADFVRSSSPPAWGVLSTDRAGRLGIEMRAWTDALEDELSARCPPPEL